MSRLNKADDIIELGLMFQCSSSGISIDDIAKKFECSRRSAERMKTVLLEKFPEKVEEVPSNDRKKRWRFKKGTMNCLISFTPNDFANLEYLKNISKNNNKTREIDELIAKIKALTPQQNMTGLNNDISAILETEGFAVRQYFCVNIEPKILELLRSSMLMLKKIKFNYSINEKVKKVTLNPYGIVISGKYYLVGFNEYKNALRTYKIEKITDLEILDEYFDNDEKFNLNDWCKNSFGVYQEKALDMVLEFNNGVKNDVLNYHFHPTQEMKELENGNVEVRFTSGGIYAICQELFKWGTNVKIKSPENFREYYKTYLSDVLKEI